MLSYFGRAVYNYKKKYLFEFTLRRDGSSVFGEDVRWATFPSVAVGWAFSEEPFFKKWWLSYAKIRASWGTSGNNSEMPIWHMEPWNLQIPSWECRGTTFSDC